MRHKDGRRKRKAKAMAAFRDRIAHRTHLHVAIGKQAKVWHTKGGLWVKAQNWHPKGRAICVESVKDLAALKLAAAKFRSQIEAMKHRILK